MDENWVKDVFAYYDDQGTGKVSTDNLGKCMRAAGSMPNNAEVEVMRQEIDPDGSGTFDEPKLYAMLERRTITIEVSDVVNAFKVFDEADSGSVPMGDLKKYLCEMGERLDDAEWGKFAAVADQAASGKCDYNAFVKNL